MDFIKSLDHLGGNINFYYKHNTSTKTTFGGISSIFLGILLILLLVSFGRNFYLRTKPLVIDSLEVPKEYRYLKFNNTFFSFALRVEDWNGNGVFDDKSFYFTTTYYSYFVNENGEFENNPNKSIKLVRCTPEMFPEDTDIRNNNKTDLYLCPEFDDNIIGGYWDSNELYYLFINLNYCREGFKNENGEDCKSDAEKDDFLITRPMVSIYHQIIEFDTISYLNPLKKKIQNNYYLLDKKMTKGITFYYQNKTIDTDFGWILEDKIYMSEIGLKDFYVDMYNIDIFKPEDGPYSIADISLYYSKENLKILREYVKIQQVAANVGGIFEFLMFFFTAIIARYNHSHLIITMKKSFDKNKQIFDDNNGYPYEFKRLENPKDNLGNSNDNDIKDLKLINKNEDCKNSVIGIVEINKEEKKNSEKELVNINNNEIISISKFREASSFLHIGNSPNNLQNSINLNQKLNFNEISFDSKNEKNINKIRIPNCHVNVNQLEKIINSVKSLPAIDSSFKSDHSIHPLSKSIDENDGNIFKNSINVPNFVKINPKTYGEKKNENHLSDLTKENIKIDKNDDNASFIDIIFYSLSGIKFINRCILTEEEIKEYFSMEDFFNKTMDLDFYVRVVNSA